MAFGISGRVVPVMCKSVLPYRNLLWQLGYADPKIALSCREANHVLFLRKLILMISSVLAIGTWRPQTVPVNDLFTY